MFVCFFYYFKVDLFSGMKIMKIGKILDIDFVCIYLREIGCVFLLSYEEEIFYGK